MIDRTASFGIPIDCTQYTYDKQPTSTMDPSLVLEQTIQDVSNLQEEFRYILEEIRRMDGTSLEHKKKFLQKDIQLQKMNKQKSSATESADEDKLTSEIREELKSLGSLQNSKCVQANTALFLVSRHLAKLEKNMTILEEDGVLPPVEEEPVSGSEMSKESSVVSIGERKKRASTTSATPPIPKKKKKLNKSNSSQKLQQQLQPAEPGALPAEGEDHIGPAEKNIKMRNKDPRNRGDGHSIENDEEDKTLYCFCQRVSFGEMVACDGPNCKYEWFHYGCVGLKEPPKGTWYCPDCTQELAKNKQKKKR